MSPACAEALDKRIICDMYEGRRRTDPATPCPTTTERCSTAARS
ncbi:MAG: hypothetical protein R2713_15630 [Ilumatobacteraceae bacterium]